MKSYLSIGILPLLFVFSANSSNRLCVTLGANQVCGEATLSQPGQIYYVATLSSISTDKYFGLSTKDIGKGERLCKLFVKKIDPNAKSIEVYKAGFNFPELAVGGKSPYQGAIINNGARFVSARVPYACGPACDASKIVWMLESLSCGYMQE